MLDIPLNSLHRPAAVSDDQAWLLVLMHGVGSNEQDLFGLAPYVPEHFHVLSLRAPYRMGPNANAWFEFSVNGDGSRTINAPQESASRALLLQTIETAARQLRVPASRVIVGGFSQGGIMGLSVLLTRPQMVAGGMALHSRLLPEVVNQIAPASEFEGKALWVSQGLQDNVIPPDNGRFICEQVQNLPLKLTYREFEGAHELRPAELQAVVAWLAQLNSVSAS
ncbi:alpha/beta hydrolase [Diaphorobacter aerolatus]|uniref:Phospholipase n=1 Tax=Diaphorobacter aerolatus TaxID=1288495 RepID=A0A7H0GLT0_9BURK|nr:phospholipase [Diaphorobacter aerolatus]QNP49246.1 phospholipase [Diaphorobacter aerolatus]